mmetsp:Transcript_6620/g.16814  ORF Transcript_6620/g.16814 Transcript_6620/m.16814 type:complete len:235 (-) Transcript_6620:1274-1978(-)
MNVHARTRFWRPLCLSSKSPSSVTSTGGGSAVRRRRRRHQHCRHHRCPCHQHHRRASLRRFRFRFRHHSARRTASRRAPAAPIAPRTTGRLREIPSARPRRRVHRRGGRPARSAACRASAPPGCSHWPWWSADRAEGSSRLAPARQRRGHLPASLANALCGQASADICPNSRAVARSVEWVGREGLVVVEFVPGIVEMRPVGRMTQMVPVCAQCACSLRWSAVRRSPPASARRI